MEGKTENIALFGQRKSYCWEDSCSINNLKSTIALIKYIIILIKKKYTIINIYILI